MPCEFGINVLGAEVCFDPLVDGILNSLDQYVVMPLINSFNEYIITPVANFFSSLWSDVQSAVTGAVASLEDWVNTAATDIENAFSTIGNDVMGALNTAWTDISSGLNALGQTVSSGLNSLGQGIEGFVEPILTELSGGLSSLTSWISSGFSALESGFSSLEGEITGYVGGALNDVARAVSSGLGDLGSYLSKLGDAVSNGMSNAISDVATLSAHVDDLFGSFTNAVAGAFKTFAVDAYNALKDVTSAILSGLEALGNSVLSFGRDVINKLIALIKPRDKDNVLDVISEVEDMAIAGTATYLGITGAVKVLENIHPFHSLSIQPFTDKIMSLFAVDTIPSKFVEGIFAFGLFTQMNYALSYMMRPRLTDRAIEERAVWYGLETQDEYAQSLRLEGLTDDLVAKAVGTLYRPMSPFVLRYMMETGLVDRDFLMHQLAMEGFSPQDSATMAKVFDALELAPFQSQIKSVIYTYFKQGLINEGEAKQIMTVFQIPEVQQEWILNTATLDFHLEQKTQLGELALSLIEKGELSVKNAIQTLISIGYEPSRAKVMATIRGVTSGPPPPKSTRALILQDALKQLSALGLSA